MLNNSAVYHRILTMSSFDIPLVAFAPVPVASSYFDLTKHSSIERLFECFEYLLGKIFILNLFCCHFLVPDYLTTYYGTTYLHQWLQWLRMQQFKHYWKEEKQSHSFWPLEKNWEVKRTKQIGVGEKSEEKQFWKGKLGWLYLPTWGLTWSI